MNQKEIEKRKINWKILIMSFIIVCLVAGLGTVFTSQGTGSDWYKSIKPNITPPSLVFPIAWSILFFLIAVSLYLCWTNSKNREEKVAVSVIFAVNFALNIIWSVLYFAMKNPRLAFFDIILLLASILSMLLLSWRISKKSFWLLIPYFIWVCFASLLNFLSF